MLTSLLQGDAPGLRPRHELEHGAGRVLGCHSGAVTAVVVSEDGRLCISGAEDGSAMVWSLPRGALLAELRGHEGAILDIAFAAGNSLAITASEDGTLRVWTLPDGGARSTLEWHSAGVYSVSVEPDGRTVRSRSYDGHVCLWDLASGQPSSAFAEPVGPVARGGAGAGSVSVGFSSEHAILVREAPGGPVQRALVGHTGRVLCTALHAEGKRLLSGGADWTVRLWETGRGTPLVPTSDVAAVAISCDGRRAIAAASDGALAIWDVATGLLTEVVAGEPAGAAIGSAGRFGGIETSPGDRLADDGHVFVVDVGAKQVRRVNLATGETTGTFADLGPLTGALVTAPEAGQLVVSVEGGLVLADARTGKPLQRVPVPVAARSGAPATPCLAITPDGRWLAVVTGPSDAATGEDLAEMAEIGEVAQVVVVDVRGEREVGRLGLPFHPVGLALSPDGACLFLGANVSVRRRVTKARDDDPTGGWFKESVETQPRVMFVDVVR